MELENFLKDWTLNLLMASSEHFAVSYFASAEVHSSPGLSISVFSKYSLLQHFKIMYTPYSKRKILGDYEIGKNTVP